MALRGLLLRHAVHCAQAPDEISGIDRDYFAGREELRQRVKGDAIVGTIEDRGEHDAVGDVKVGVAGGEAAAFEDYGLRHGQFDHGELLAILIAGSLQAAQVSAQGGVVHIFGVGLDHSDDRALPDEARKIVDVAVSVVAEDAASQPNGVRRAEVVGEGLLVVNPGHVGIALLLFAKQAFFGGEDCAFTIDVDRAAFQHDALAQRLRADFLCMGDFAHEAANLFIEPPVGVFGPSVKPEL